MYGREKVELFLLAREEGMSIRRATDFAGVSAGAAQNWAQGKLPRSYTGVPARRRIRVEDTRRRGCPMPEDRSTCEPPGSGPLAGLTPDQIENILPGAVLADLKAVGWDPASISNRSKCELGERLRRATALPLRSITGFLRISKSSYEYWRRRLAEGPSDRDADIRKAVRDAFGASGGSRGYREVHARLRRAMREEGLRPAYARHHRRGHGSYAGEVSKAPPNLVARDFRAAAPDELWLTDVTEFRPPSGEKAYLSAVVDCFDGMPAGWSVGRRPIKRLANSSLLEAPAPAPSSAPTAADTTAGRSGWASASPPSWSGACRPRAAAPTVPPPEGFFGRLKNEFFYWVGLEGASPSENSWRSSRSASCTTRDRRIKRSLGWLNPMEYRRKLGYA